jgi:hypothetical protein
MKSVQANNPYLIEIFERNTEEWINCLTADEAAKQKLAIVVEHAGNSRAIGDCREDSANCRRESAVVGEYSGLLSSDSDLLVSGTRICLRELFADQHAGVTC